MKKLLLLTALLGIISCQSKNEESLKDLDSSQTVVTPKEPETPTVPEELVEPPTPCEPEESFYSSLKGTKWKLQGLYDVKSNSLRILKPVDCEECYTLTFDTDHTAVVNSINHIFKLDLKNLDPCVMLVAMLICERYFKDGKDYCDSDIFCTSVTTTSSCQSASDELKLFSYHKTNYLLFKLIKQ